LGISIHDLLALGRANPDDPSENFNMAYLATHGSGAVNGVSRLHQDVSRQIFGPLYPRRPTTEVPVGHVTNGVHVPTWDSACADELWTRASGNFRWLGTADTLEADIRRIGLAELWKMRTDQAANLIEFARNHLSRQLASAGASPETVRLAKALFDPNALTLGFARRFATYKRPNLLLHDPARLLRLLADPNRPVQLIIAGKAHPEDRAGQNLIHEWIEFIGRPEVRPHVAFLSDYDMLLTEQLVQGVDVWINTPRRPWEASGTSGMKVLVNGGINLSELDGWWAEAYSPELGWALGDGREHGDDPTLDAVEANELYELLEQQVVPEFYARDESGIPAAWVRRMQESMAKLTPRFSAERAVREYADRYYLPAARSYKLRTANDCASARTMVDRRHALDQGWPAVRFANVNVETLGENNVFEVELHLGALEASKVCVELYADATEDAASTVLEMERIRALEDGSGCVYTATVPATRPASNFTARVTPRCDGVSIPLEDSRIIWQR
jgi:starch phosphorylase